MEIKIYQSEWHGLKFKDLDVELSSSRLPDAHFYSNFYGALQKKYSSYEDIDKNWLSHKINTAANLLKNCAESSNILGYGCGIAYIESIIVCYRQQQFMDMIFQTTSNTLVNPLKLKI